MICIRLRAYYAYIHQLFFLILLLFLARQFSRLVADKHTHAFPGRGWEISAISLIISVIMAKIFRS